MAISSPTLLQPWAIVSSSFIDDELFACTTASPNRLVKGVITIDELPVSLIEGKTIRYAFVTSPNEESIAPTGTLATIGLDSRQLNKSKSLVPIIKLPSDWVVDDNSPLSSLKLKFWSMKTDAPSM